MKIGIMANLSRPAVLDLVRELIGWLKAHQVEAYLDPALSRELGDHYPLLDWEAPQFRVDLLAVFGGDGTLLAAARAVGRSEIPIFGVNLGGFGFLTSSSVEELYPSLEQILSGSYRVEPRMVLEVILTRSGAPVARHCCLNDAVIHKGSLSRVLTFEVEVGEEWVGSYNADGLIISTPTGSTGYSLSAGGPILLPSMDAITATPICPHTLAVRPLVVPGNLEISVNLHSQYQESLLTLDGQVEEALQADDRVTVRRASHNVYLAYPVPKSIFSLLRRKLHWGGREEPGPHAE